VTGRRSRPATALGLALVVASLGSAAAQERPHGPRLTGRLLVATDRVDDPRFVRTVIYLVRHDESGAMGLVVNRPMGEVPLSRLLADLGLDAAGVSGEVRVHYGGPVDPARGLVLHSDDYRGVGTVVLRDSVALTAQSGIFRDMAAGRGPSRSLFALGHAGWAPGQLEAELAAGAWVAVRADAGLVFDPDHEEKWRRAMARRGVDL
jgi:putative transcriptional regulator